jgi:catechol 2,3-dioxygenase-like lactoylglutathione lyase family enzyme
MAITRAHFIFFVRDQAASAAFFRTVLELAPRLDVPGMTEFELPGGAVLGLMPEAGITRLLGDAVDPRQANGAPRAELYLVVDEPVPYLARALAAGGREASPLVPRDWGHVAGYVRDLDGHVIAFAREA